MNRKFIFILIMMFIPFSLSWGEISKREQRKQKRAAKKNSEVVEPSSTKKEKKKSKKKRNKRLTDEGLILKQEPYNEDEIYKLKELYDAGNHAALDMLIKIYQDKNQMYNIRILSLEMLSNIDNPLIKDAIQSMLENVEFLELEYLAKSIEVLKNYNDFESTNSLVTSLANSENKIMELRELIINAIGENGAEDEIITLLDLYEISMTNHSRMSELLTLTLGNMDDDRSIPILIDIASNKNINIRIRNTAVEVLSRKNAPELVDYFVEMLGDPETNEEMLGFVSNMMGEINNDRMTMALLESYQTGKNRYYANLHSIMTALNDYNNPKIKPTFIEIANTDGFPRLLRIKAIQGLAKFNDPGVLDYIIPILENPDNYEYYFDILSLAQELNAKEFYMNKIRMSAHKAMLNSIGKNN